jgi:serine/threonine protein kinase
MHRQGIYHRDIKPDNILILDKEELQVCVADLGLACRMDDFSELKVKCGSPGYVDPEVLKGHQFNNKSDIFSLGCLLYNLITGKLLFSGKDPYVILFKNQSMDPSPIIDVTCQHVS